jgi:lysozyme
MKKGVLIWIVIFLIVAIVLFKKRSMLAELLKRFEGFSSKPYWDYKQWTWGYGTKVPDSTSDKTIVPQKTITQSQALTDAIAFSNNQYQELKNYIKVPLKTTQWDALLSFAYNLGTGSAIKLAPNINTKNYSALKTQWLSYINAGGVPNADLIKRRQVEFALFMS